MWLAGAAKADEDSRAKRREDGDRERAGLQALEERATAQQRPGIVAVRTRPGEAHQVITEAGPAGAKRCCWHPIRHQLGQIADHVEGPTRRDATAARAGQ